MGINYLVASVTQGELNGVNLFGNDSDVPKPKVWHMLTGTVSGSTVRMYLDGELKQEGDSAVVLSVKVRIPLSSDCSITRELIPESPVMRSMERLTISASTKGLFPKKR